MNKLLEILGTVAGLLGVLICLIAGLVRLSGSYNVLDYEAMTLFIVGIGLMVAGCLAKLHALGAR